MIEMGLMLPILIFTFAMVLELSFYMSQLHLIARAARDGARVGSMTIEGPDADGTEITANAIEQAELVLETAGYTCDTGCDVDAVQLPDSIHIPDSIHTGCDVDAVWELDTDVGYYFITVTVVYPYRSFTTVIPELGTSITGSFVMMTQQQ